MSARSCFGGVLAVLIMLIVLASSVFVLPAGEEKATDSAPTRTAACAEGNGSAFSFEFKDPEFTPNCTQYELPLGSSSIGNIEQIRSAFDLNQSEEQYLLEHGYLGLPSERFTNWNGEPYTDFGSAYGHLKESDLPVFVTTDSMLHVYHVLFDTTLKEIEEQYLYQLSMTMSIGCLQKAIGVYANASGTMTYSYTFTTSTTCGMMEYNITETMDLKEAARKVVAFYGVPLKLLDPNATVPEYAMDLVNAEVSLIKAHAGFGASPILDKSKVHPILGYTEDYSQYKPRGHYTSSETLERYFQAMMWYGRMGFRLKSGEETIQAIMVSDSMKTASYNGSMAKDCWKSIYDVTSFFVGTSDDLTYQEYNDAIAATFGQLSQDYKEVLNATLLTSYRNLMFTIRLPLICSSPIFANDENASAGTAGLKFMGQRLVPDSYMFQQLVFPEVGCHQGSGVPQTMSITMSGKYVRGVPRGVDIQGILGSEMAIDYILRDGDDQYSGFSAQYDKLQGEFLTKDQSEWSQNLYWGWLYAMRSLCENFSAQEYPTFMKERGWQAEKLNTNLGSWSELRHDTILYAKQSYTPGDGNGVPPVETPRGYVEPIPKFFSRLVQLTNATLTGLQALQVLGEDQADRLTDLSNLLSEFEGMSLKELSNEQLTESDLYDIFHVGDSLAHILRDLQERDLESRLVADVHTDCNMDPADGVWQKCLEVGTGPVDVVIVAAKHANGTIEASVGPIFSYYEFRQQISERMTDEEWRTKLESGNGVPPKFDWMDHPEDLGTIGVEETVGDIGLSADGITASSGSALIGDVVVLDVIVQTYLGPGMQAILVIEESPGTDNAGTDILAEFGVDLKAGGRAVFQFAWNTSFEEFGEHTLTARLTNLSNIDRVESNDQASTVITLLHLDTDGDGVPDTCDAFPTDPSCSLDTDLDGYPDAWNPGKNASDSTQGLILDVFPRDVSQWSDMDGDGFGDNASGSNADAFPGNPDEWKDTDGDGVGDNSDAFPRDPAASVDSDHDGFPDSWNIGKGPGDSTDELQLDAFPSDPMMWKQDNTDVAASGSGTYGGERPSGDPAGGPDTADEAEDQADNGAGDDKDAAPAEPSDVPPAKKESAQPWILWTAIALVLIAIMIITAMMLAKRGNVRRRPKRRRRR